MEKKKMGGGALTFAVLQLVYLFFFLFLFPASFQNALGWHSGVMDTVTSWVSTATLVGYSVLALVSVVGLIMRRVYFLLLFQLAGLVALVGNLAAFVLRQFTDSRFEASGQYRLWGGNYYWFLFVIVLFWLVGWCLFFMRSSQVYSYMGEDDAYLKKALFTKNVKTPAPYVEPAPYNAGYPAQPAPGQYPPAGPAPYYAGQPAYGRPMVGSPARYTAPQTQGQPPVYPPIAPPIAPQPVPAQTAPRAQGQPPAYPHLVPPASTVLPAGTQDSVAR